VRTRLELIIRQRRIKPAQLAREAGYARQHLHRIREGDVPTNKRSRAAITSAIHRIRPSPEDSTELFFEPLDRERVAASVQKLIDARASVEELLLAAEQAGESEQVVRALLSAGHDEIDRLPERASALFKAAETAVSRLRSCPHPLEAALKGHCEIGRARALRMLGNYEDALAQLTDAEQHFQDAEVCLSEVGDVCYTRAVILSRENDGPRLRRQRCRQDTSSSRLTIHAVCFALGCWPAASQPTEGKSRLDGEPFSACSDRGRERATEAPLRACG
jgi:hypothetical protein